MIKVAIVENDKPTRQRLEAAINDDNEMFLCGAFANAEELIRIYNHLDVQVVIMDIDLGKTHINGIEAIRQLNSVKKEQKVEFIMCTSYFEDDKIFAAYSYGAHGYLNKDEVDDEKIMLAVKQVHAGGRPMTPIIAQKTLMYFEKKHSHNELLEKLTHREHETLVLMSKGNSYKMTAGIMNIAASTINGYVKNIYDKLKVHCLAEAIEILNQQTP